MDPAEAGRVSERRGCNRIVSDSLRGWDVKRRLGGFFLRNYQKPASRSMLAAGDDAVEMLRALAQDEDGDPGRCRPVHAVRRSSLRIMSASHLRISVW